MRWKERKRTQPASFTSRKKTADDSDLAPPPSKKALAQFSTHQGTNEGDNSTHIAEIEKEWSKTKPHKPHIKMLLKATFNANQEWIRAEPDGKLAPVLDRIPCYTVACYVSWVTGV